MNNVNAALDINEFFVSKQVQDYIAHEESVLKSYQAIPSQYLMKNAHVNGLLVNVEMGFGKTRIIIDIVEQLHNKYSDWKIIILTLKTLHNNLRNELIEYCKIKGLNQEQVMNKYRYVTYNSYNMFDNIMNETNDLYDTEKYNGLIIDETNTLDKCIVVIDEFQLFIHSIANHSKNAVQLYYALMNTKHKKIIGLTGTLIINNIFSAAIGFNLLRGYMTVKGRTEKYTLFPEREDLFYTYFVRDGHMINKDKYANRISGLVYYYGSKLEGVKDKLDIARLLPTKVIRLPMSSSQFTQYQLYKDMELKEKSFGQKQVGLIAGKSHITSTFKVKTRKVSNFSEPITADVFKRIRDGSISLDEISPKMIALMKIIDGHDRQLGIVYSSFVTKQGIDDIALILQTLYGYTNESTMHDETHDYKRYAIITGAVDVDDRYRIMDIYNRADNVDGKYVRFILLSGAAALGVNLYRGRWCVLFDMPWYESTTMQIVRRILRLHGHTDMPEDQRTVQPYELIMVELASNEAITENNAKSESTEEYIYRHAQEAQRLIDENNDLIIYSSINCLLHNNIDPNNITYEQSLKCNVCKRSASDELYNVNIDEDINQPSSCEPIVAKTASVQHINIDGDDYYYDDDNIYIKNGDAYELFNNEIIRDKIIKVKGGVDRQLVLASSELMPSQQAMLHRDACVLLYDKWNVLTSDYISIDGDEYMMRAYDKDSLWGDMRTLYDVLYSRNIKRRSIIYLVRK